MSKQSSRFRQLSAPDLVVFSSNLEIDFMNRKPHDLFVQYGADRYKLRPGDRFKTGVIGETRYVSVGEARAVTG